MRLRAQALRAIVAKDMAEGVGSRARCAGVALALILAGILGACVQAKGPLLTNGKQLLGDQIQLNVFGDFADGKAGSLKTSVFHWSANRYERVSGDLYDIKYLTAEPLTAADFLIEATDEKVYAFFLAHKLAEGAYGIRPVDENSLDAATQKRTCVTQSSDICVVATRAHLEAFARATMRKPPPKGFSGLLAVISAVAN
jgi:hypothetical protein